MSNPFSNQVLRPTNPILSKDTNRPRENGQTRVLLDGSLLYQEPLTNIEIPAVRLEDIRPRLVKEASKKLSYRFPKSRGYENTNVTAFVKKDYNYGPKRANRPDRLFQIDSKNQRSEKPDGYIMDQDRIVLDAFDHGLRNFGNQLPMYVSSELEGHDIEDYLRRNREISVYDLIARAPNGYYKGKPETKNTIPNPKKTTKETKTNKARKDEKVREWHDGPPRVGTFSMRATRFRLNSGCLSWERKDGTLAKNQRILDVIPAQFKAVNSTRGWRDLSTSEIKKVKSGALRKPQLGPKHKRNARIERDQEEEEVLGEDDMKKEGDDLFDGEDGWINTITAQNTGIWPDYHPEDFESLTPVQAGLQGNDPWPRSQSHSRAMGYYPQESAYHQPGESPNYHHERPIHLCTQRPSYTQTPSYPAKPAYSQQQLYQTHSKRKWEQRQTTEHINGQRPTKRTKGHAFTPSISTPSTSTNGQVPVQYGQSPYQNIQYHQPGGRMPTFSSDPLPFTGGDSWTGAPFTTEEQYSQPFFDDQEVIQNAVTSLYNTTNPMRATMEARHAPLFDDQQGIRDATPSLYNATNPIPSDPEGQYSPLFNNQQGLRDLTPSAYNNNTTAPFQTVYHQVPHHAFPPYAPTYNQTSWLLDG